MGIEKIRLGFKDIIIQLSDRVRVRVIISGIER